jgi:alpha-L-rhamnosidase
VHEEAIAIPQARPSNLRCEYAENPVGVDCTSPRFSWSMSSTTPGSFQTAYQIKVASSLAAIESGVGDLWDSGRVQTDRSINIPYQGNCLRSGGIYYWTVTVWDEHGNPSLPSLPARFEMGLLREDDWHARWMAYPQVGINRVTYFRREFCVNQVPNCSRAYISGLGYYELRINGCKVGDHVLDPGWTDYQKRVLYSTYDVTEYLKVGTNAVGVIAAPGWVGIPKVRLQIHIDLPDGSRQIVVSGRDEGWITTVKGPITVSTIYNGEHYDARLEMPGWDMPGYIAPEHWRPPILVEPPGGKMVSQMNEPIKVVEEITPIDVTNPKDGVFVFDMGVNMAGWVSLTTSGTAGTVVTLKYGEVLHDDGTVSQDNLRSAAATDKYILKGDGLEVWEPSFTYHGFRYVQVEGYPGTPDVSAITGKAVRSSVRRIGSFRCSHSLINDIHDCAVRTEASNLHSIPTDCPQRDERMGWLNDMTVRAEEAMYNFDMSRLYTKWMNDIADTQGEVTGAIADTAPYRIGGRPADPVSSSYLIVPWLMYLHFGDESILRRHYDGMKRWVSCLQMQSSGHIVQYSYYGDWASPLKNAVPGSLGAGAVSAVTPGELMSTGFYYLNCVLLSKMAAVLGETEDESRYTRLAAEIAKAFNEAYLHTDRGEYATGSQGSNTFALYLGLVPREHQAAVLNSLVDDIVSANDTHLTTGNICTRYVFDVLTQHGRADVAFALATQTTYPSWGYMIKCGATTIWERWEYSTSGPMNSHNHPMYASIDAWFYRVLGGISPDPRGPGFGRIEIRPHLIDSLEWVKCCLDSIRGPIMSSWRRVKDGVEMSVEIPWNAKATVSMPTLGIDPSKVSLESEGTTIWAGGRDLQRPLGVLSISEGPESIDIEVGSGAYTFTLTASS